MPDAPLPETAPSSAPAPAPAGGGAPAASLTEAFKSGQLAFQPGERVPVRLADGSIGDVPAEQAQTVVDGGGELVDAKTFHQAELEGKYGGVGGALAAGGAGFARGFTVGLSDPLAVGAATAFGGEKAGESLRERLAAYQELHPIASGVGEVAGVVAPALFSGGAAAGVEGGSALARGARVAGALNEGIGAVGRGAEALAGRATAGLGLAGAEGLAPRALARAIEVGARGAAEGALYGAGSAASQMALSEEHLGDPAAVGEKLLAGMGHGALLGGVLGAVGGAGAEVGKAALLKGQPFLRARAEESAVKALNMRKLFTGRAAELPGGERAIGRLMLDEGVIKAGDTAESLAPKVMAKREAAAAAIDAVVSKVAPDAGVTLREAVTALEKRATEFDRMLGYESAAAAVRKQAAQLQTIFAPKLESAAAAGIETAEQAAAHRLAAEEMRIPLTDLLAARRSLEGTINWQTEQVAAKGARAAGRTLEDLVVEAGERAAEGAKAGAGAEWRTAYQDAKLAFRRWKVASDGVEDAVTRAHANAGHSLTDKIFAAHGVAGAVAGVAAGHPTALAGLAAGEVSKQIRTRGSSIAATTLDSLASLGNMAKQVDAVDREVAVGVKRAFSTRTAAPSEGAAAKASGRAKGAAGGSLPERFAARVEAVQHVQNGEAGLVKQHLEEQAAPHAMPHAPKVMAALAQTADRGAAYLAGKVPKSSGPPPGVIAGRVPRPPAEAEMAKFMRMADAVDDPVHAIVGGLERGRLSPDAVMAVEKVYPQLFAQIREGVVSEVVRRQGRGETVPYSLQVDLGLLFHAPTTWSLTPEGIRTLQGAVGSSGSGQPGGPKPQPGAPPNAPPQGQPGMGPAHPAQTPEIANLQTDAERRAHGGQMR